MEPILSPYLNQFRGNKVVVFFETAPYSDHFEQVMLTPDVALELHIFLKSRMQLTPNGRGFVVPTNNVYSYDFPNIPDNYRMHI